MKALDLMTHKMITVRADDSVLTAVKLMLDNNISGLPVVDDHGKLVGIITEGDLIRRAELATEKRRSWWRAQLAGPGKLAAEYAHTHAHRVRDVMTSPVHSVDFGVTAEEIVELMERHSIKRIPVVRGTTLVGIVSRRDLLRIAYWLIVDPSSAAPTRASDSIITERLISELRQQTWAAGNRIEPRVHEGVVDLCGIIFDERERSALRVLAEGVPGVVAIRDSLVHVEPHSGFVIPPPTQSQ
jgi:CBS-domain-containing membrane protein